MRETVNKIAILDCIGFDLQQQSRPMQVRFAKCLVHEDGTIERQFSNDRLLCHRVTIEKGEDIDEVMALVCADIARMGYDPPTQSMIERIKAHCAIEWTAPAEPLMIEATVAMPFEFARAEERVV